MSRPLRPLKKLPSIINEFRISLNKDNYDSINIYFQDESRFGLMTKQKRVLVSKGVKPVGKYQHSYKWLWLWGCFSPITGGSFYWETPVVSNEIFEAFLKDFSQASPKELKLLVIDNAGFHACQNIEVPDNVKLIRIPPYSPELNPAERVWQWMKDRVSMKFFDSTKALQDKISELVKFLTPDVVKSLTDYDLYTKPFFEQISL